MESVNNMFTDCLFIDTESNPDTKEPLSLQWRMNGKHGIITEFSGFNYEVIRYKWNTAKAIILFNAPYDLGVMSIIFPNNHYNWKIKPVFGKPGEKSAAWFMELFGNKYEVRRINFTRNMIKPMNRAAKTKSTPIVDILKLWSILVSEDDISLKSLIKRELGLEPIKYTPEAALTDEYRYQDVDCLEKIAEKFFEKIKNVKEVKGYTWEQWADIKTPATFTKNQYEAHYPLIPEWKKENDATVSALMLEGGLEDAYHGGITLALHRGELKNTAWVDIKGAYSKAIDTLNTDSYLKFGIQEIAPADVDFTTPILLNAKVNFVLRTVNHSLKLFYLESPVRAWIWNFDIVACQNLAEGFQYEIFKAYKPIPLNPTPESLPKTWNREKDEEKARNGKTTLYQFYKFLSNTSYGIKAQRKPFETQHTNMIIAGMITAKVHEILSKIISTIKSYGYRNVYNDTDSSCLAYPDTFDNSIVDAINARIAPFEVDFEGLYYKTKILSLKRYISLNEDARKNKIKLHGRGRYDVKGEEILNFVLTRQCKERPLRLVQFAANTPVGMKMILSRYPFCKQFAHPFMFVKNMPCDRMLSEFMAEWYKHIDTKTSFEEKDGDFERKFHTFKNIFSAEVFFGKYGKADKPEDVNMMYRDWNAEIEEDFIL